MKITQCALPLLIGVAISGVALAQTAAPTSATVQKTTTQQTTSRTAIPNTQSTTTTTTSVSFAKPEHALSESAIKSHIASAGYKEVKNLKFDDGVWKAKARGGNHNWVKIRVAPNTGKVYSADAPSKLNQSEVKAKLAAQGYENISDVDFDNGLWSADAQTKQGKKVDVWADPDTGTVVAQSND